jgi:hypothetical protein
MHTKCNLRSKLKQQASTFLDVLWMKSVFCFPSPICYVEHVNGLVNIYKKGKQNDTKI